MSPDLVKSPFQMARIREAQICPSLCPLKEDGRINSNHNDVKRSTCSFSLSFAHCSQEESTVLASNTGPYTVDRIYSD